MSSLPPESRSAERPVASAGTATAAGVATATAGSRPAAGGGLNPSMKAEVDASHGSRFEGTDPLKTVSVQDPDEGRSWPIVWAVVVLLGVVALVYYLV